MNLIDRDALIASGKMYSSYEIGVVKAAPTIDAVPVVHGHWIVSGATYKRFQCSVCHFRNFRLRSKYCPNCGARMDGGECNGTD